jgi:hypothetical protein
MLNTHAQRELLIAGYGEYEARVLASAMMVPDVVHPELVIPEGRDARVDIAAVAQGEVLTPLTNDPSEWELDDGDDDTGVEVWISRRDNRCVSLDGGLTYTRDETPTITETSEPAGYWIDDHDERHASQQEAGERDVAWVPSLATTVNRAMLDAEVEAAIEADD